MSISEKKVKSDKSSNEIGLYEALSVVSERMLMAAEKGAWDEMLLQEKSHEELQARLIEIDGNQRLGSRELDRKAELIEKILSMDKKTQGFITKRMDTLKKSYEEERKLMQSYGSQAG